MQCFMIVFLYLLFILGSEGITTHSVTGCSYLAVLNCSNTEMTHVERITFYKGTDCNHAVADLQVCGQPITGNDSGLAPACTGKKTCHLFYNECPGNKAAKLDYRCIPGNDVKDMCGEFIIENTNRIFLSTPNYPFTPNFTDISPCRCSLRGSSITSIHILELVLQTSTDGTKSSLEINYGDVTYKAESFRVLFNKSISIASTTAEIILDHNNVNEHYLWMELQGVGMRVLCNDDSHGISSTLASPTTSSPSSSSPSTRSTQATTSKESSQDKATNIILAVLLSMCILIICIATISIIVLLRRKKLVWMNSRESNAYSGLDRTLRSSENDGTYLELNDRNSTPQDNVSHYTHNDYQHVS